MEVRLEGRKQDTGNKSGGYYISPRKRSCKPGLGMWQEAKSLASDGGLNTRSAQGELLGSGFAVSLAKNTIVGQSTGKTLNLILDT